MKKAVKITVILLLFFVVFPATAGLAVMALWNNIVPAVCGFNAITFWQATGLFILGQILTGGIVFALFVLGGGVHAIGRHHSELRSHWHNMSDEQRHEFIERRRREHFGFRNRKNDGENAAW